MATVDAPEEPALKSDIGQQQAEAVEGPALEHGQSSDRSVATDDAPEEPTLESGLAQQAAAAEQGMLRVLEWQASALFIDAMSAAWSSHVIL